jgi:hypothetical protein
MSRSRYGPKSQKPYPCPPGVTAVDVRNVSFRNIRGHGKTDKVGVFNCGAVAPCTGITLTDVHLAAGSGGEAKFECEECAGHASNCSPAACFTDTSPETTA